MPLILAIEPDPKQAATLKRLVRERVRADLVLDDSKDAALAAFRTQVPDLILVTALLSPREKMPFEVTPLAIYLTRLGSKPEAGASLKAIG